MPNTRQRTASSHIADGTCTISIYSRPDADGKQHVVATTEHSMTNLPTPTTLNLAAVGFAAVAGNRYQNHLDGDIPAIIEKLYTEMLAGDWLPGKRDASEQEPTDLMKAIAEATNTPIFEVQQRFETEMVKLNDGSLYKDAAGKPRRFFSKAVCSQLESDPAIAPILARLAQERARTLASAAKERAKQPSKLATMFTTHPTEVAAD